jgi:hypothetical protein
MPTLLEYISKLQREHRYRIKMAFQPTEQQLEVLERHMKKYDALEVGRPEKLMLQAQPMDFPQLGGHEIVILDIVTRLPVSMPQLEAELRGLLFVRDGTIRVFGRDEPVEKEIEDRDEVGPGEAEKTAKVGTEYTEAEANPVKADDATGDKYNQDLLKELNDVRADARANITQSKEKAKVSPTWEGPADGTTSPVGTKKQDVPYPTKSGAKK